MDNLDNFEDYPHAYALDDENQILQEQKPVVFGKGQLQMHSQGDPEIYDYYDEEVDV